MKIDLKELPGHFEFAFGNEQVESLIGDLPLRKELGSEAGQAGEGKVVVDLYLEDANVFARGNLEAWVELACSRCLTPTRLPLAEELSLSFLPTADLPAHEDEEEPDEEAIQAPDTYGYEGESLDMKSAVDERLILSIPFAPLCQDECKGLCSQCGANLNDGECGCDRHVIDPRLAALKNFKV